MTTILSDLETLKNEFIDQAKSHDVLSKLLITNAEPLVGNYGIVLYTDGGSNDDGTGGSGVHGYIYQDFEPNEKMPEYSAPKSVPSDRGYMLKSLIKEGVIKRTTEAWNIVTKVKDEFTPKRVKVLAYIDIAKAVTKSTNNKTEALSMLYALTLVQTLNLNAVHIRADSDLTIKATVAWADSWAKNGWRKNTGEEPANVDIFKAILVEKHKLIEMGIPTNIEWVKGHSDFLGNIQADELAAKGKALTKNNDLDFFLEVNGVDGYWKDEVAINPLLSEPRFYYTTAVNAGYREGIGYIYHTGSHGKKDEMIGKKMSDINASVIVLKKPEPVLEQIRKSTLEIKPFQDGTLYDCRLDVVSKPAIYNEIVDRGFKFMAMNKETGFVMTHDSLPVLRIPRSPNLTFRAQGYFISLENILCDYINGTLSEDYVKTDITDFIYSRTKDAKGKEKVKVIDAPESAYKVDINYPGMKDKKSTITLTYGIDIPRRLNLQRLASDIDRVEVLTWAESTVSYRYVTLIITKNGECGVWAGAHSNLRIVLN